MTAKQLTATMLILVSALYTVAAIGYWMSDRPGMAVAFIGDVAANVGFIADSL